MSIIHKHGNRRSIDGIFSPKKITFLSSVSLNFSELYSAFSKLSRLIGISLIMLSANLYALADREDYDLDGDGLIEIHDTEDFLAIPNVYKAKDATLYGMTVGCPEEGCSGYELVDDIDLFGVQFRHYSNRFFYGQIFEGNNHSISGIVSTSIGTASLFNHIKKTVIKNLKLESVFMQGEDGYIGPLVNTAQNSLFVNVEVAGYLASDHYIAGLVSSAHSSTFANCRFQGTMDAKPTATISGLVTFGRNIEIYSSFAKVAIPSGLGPSMIGGLIHGKSAVGVRENTIKASFAELRYSMGSRAPDIYGLTKWDSPRIEDSYIIHHDTGSKQSKIKYYYGEQGGSSKTLPLALLQMSERECTLGETEEDCEVLKHTNGWDVHVDQGAKQVWNIEYSRVAPTINSNLMFDSGGWLEACEDTCDEVIGFLLRKSGPENAEEQAAGSVGQAFIMLFLALYSVRRLRRFGNT